MYLWACFARISSHNLPNGMVAFLRVRSAFFISDHCALNCLSITAASRKRAAEAILGAIFPPCESFHRVDGFESVLCLVDEAVLRCTNLRCRSATGISA